MSQTRLEKRIIQITFLANLSSVFRGTKLAVKFRFAARCAIAFRFTELLLRRALIAELTFSRKEKRCVRKKMINIEFLHFGGNRKCRKGEGEQRQTR